MGKIKQGILGGFSGKVANIIGGSWKGIAYMRSQPLSVSNPRTAGQVTQRNKFSFTVEFASIILASIVKPLWDRFAQAQSGYNAFVSANVGTMVDWATTTWPNVVTSLGKMVGVFADSLTFDAGANELTLSWPTDLPDSFSLDNDKVYVTVVNRTKEFVEGFADVAIRSDGTVTLPIAGGLASGDNIFTFLSFLRSDGSIVSNSTFFTGSVG